MRYVALALTIVGIFVLVGVMVFSPAREINSLDNVQVNEKVEIEGIVTEERIIKKINIMQVNGIELVCDCILSFKGKKVRVMGVVEEFNGKRQVRVLRISEK